MARAKNSTFSSGKVVGKMPGVASRGRIWKNLAENLALAPLAVREIERADSSNPYEHENGGEQDDYDQGSLLVLQYVGSNSIAKP